ncbi:MAG: glutamate 5-kinase [Atopobiaceae bacterium]
MSALDGHTNVVVAKLGSSTLVDASGAPDRAFIGSVCDQVARLGRGGCHVILVSSGAAAAGRERLGFRSKPTDIPSLQACAAAGQAALTEVYAEELAKRGVPCGQVLLTRRDVVDREAYLNARNTLGRLLELGAVPVVNENDTVSVSEFTFGDNDMLGAIVSALVGARLYVILSDVDGLYTANPQKDHNARLVEHVDAITPQLESMAGGAGSSVGTGGMASKLRAARAVMAAGIPMVICRGRDQDALVRAAGGERIGTRFVPSQQGSREAGRKLWIGLAEVVHGTLHIDAGARRAITQRGASLLPVGVTSTVGSYAEGDVVNVVDEEGQLVGRGVVRYSSDDMVRVRGLSLEVIGRFMPSKATQPAIHRDELLVF